jgi:uncharacterized oxidoreductase
MPNFTEQDLRRLTNVIVRRMGSNAEEAERVTDHLVRANLAGHDSHGVGMLPAYIRLLREQLLMPNQTLETVLDFGALLVFDAKLGFGANMATEAVRHAMSRARELGTCVLGLRNSAHIGRIGTYGEQATQAGMAFIAYVNVADHHDVSAPWGCAEPRLGTNPFVTAVPGSDGPVLLDFATTTIAAGKARVARNKESNVPDGCMLDAQGLPTNDPRPFIDDRIGALTTFGQHKGSGLAVMCEIMASAVAGGQPAGAPRRGGIVNSMFAVLVDLDRLRGSGQVQAGVEATLAHIRSSRTAPGFAEIQMPGEPERHSAEARRASGIPVDDRTWTQILEAAAALGLTARDLQQNVP